MRGFLCCCLVTEASTMRLLLCVIYTYVKTDVADTRRIDFCGPRQPFHLYSCNTHLHLSRSVSEAEVMPEVQVNPVADLKRL